MDTLLLEENNYKELWLGAKAELIERDRLWNEAKKCMSEKDDIIDELKRKVENLQTVIFLNRLITRGRRKKTVDD